MTKVCTCGAKDSQPEPAVISMYRTGRVDDALDKLSQIKALARVAACASDTVLSVDLEKSGYGGVFELIHRLSDEAYMEVDGWWDLSGKSG